MKKLLIIFLLLTLSTSLFSQETCEVQICNKLKRFTLSIRKYLNDKFGEVCFDSMIPKENAIEGKELSSESKWYQGSINPTKRSVTYIKKVYRCQ